jgi:hypothetical protein
MSNIIENNVDKKIKATVNRASNPVLTGFEALFTTIFSSFFQ